jgi:hypothetical protein
MLGFNIFKRKSPPAYSVSDAVVYDFPQPAEPHLATVKDRVRSSGLTSVRFVAADLLVAADFASKKCYLVRVDGSHMTILDSLDTVIADGTPVETDLIDYADGEFIVSNFYQGTFSRFAIEGDKIRFVAEVPTGGPPNMHGLRFIPGYPQLVWLTFCNNKRPCHSIMDIQTGKTLHHFDTDQQCQDIAFVNGHAVVFARTDHISKGEKIPAIGSRKNIMFATAYVYRLPENLVNEPPVMVSRWKGEGHLDASKEMADGRILCANQYLDRIDIFTLSDKGELSLDGVINGFSLPHGLDVSGDLVAITNYGDQTLRILKLRA